MLDRIYNLVSKFYYKKIKRKKCYKKRCTKEEYYNYYLKARD
ncbi:MAG: hypothetical protein E6860_05225 [Clostridium sp.]|nr:MULTISPECIES: hypothetical protein [Clostridium]DAR40203.1 MAG TPA: hypothetical protein [Caudoviricetes sp.]MDU1309922.1 hypothetical protein [Clostridium sp.]MDU1407078.1 hypothetical protein [Clostridium sp.]MDU1584933.1 hypothetical protein [Clostridium sp.]MDU1978061.1 hypothetical protein [Clostridium sp.]